MEKFSKRLSDALYLRNMRATELATRTGLSKPLISQYINEKIGAPTLERVELIAKVLDVSPAWLLGFDVPVVGGFDISVEEHNLLSMYRQLPANRKSDVADFLKMLYLQEIKKGSAQDA